MSRNILIAALGLLLSFLAASSYSQVSAEQPMVKQSAVSDFLAAARANNTTQLSRGLRLGVPVDSRDENGRTALLIAIYANAIDAARLLVQAGANVNAKDRKSDSPYLYAGAEGRLEILKMTVAAGADLKSVNRYGGTALTPAAHHGHLDVVRYLLTTDIDINQVNNLGWTSFAGSSDSW